MKTITAIIVLVVISFATPTLTFAYNSDGPQWECEAPDLVIHKNKWAMISLPCDPDGRTVKDLFGALYFTNQGEDWYGIITLEYGTDYVLYGYNSKEGSYHMLAETDVMVSGMGYWIIQVHNANYSVYTMTGKTAKTWIQKRYGCGGGSEQGCIYPSTPIGGTDKVAWHMVGNPYDYTAKAWQYNFNISTIDCREESGCSWATAASAIVGDEYEEYNHPAVVNGDIWMYDGNAYQSIDMTNPDAEVPAWTAFWMVTLTNEKKYGPGMSIFFLNEGEIKRSMQQHWALFYIGV